jgi:GlpG protein
MRLLDHLPDQSTAQRFADYALTQGIACQIDESRDGRWQVWVEDEDQLASASALLAPFRQNPDDPRYTAGAAAQKLRQEQTQRQQRLHRNFRDVRTQWHRSAHGNNPLTLALIAACLVVALGTRLGEQPEPVMSWLTIATPNQDVTAELERAIKQITSEPALDDAQTERQIERINEAMAQIHQSHRLEFREIREGQVWRLFTPIFLHFGVLHLLFNMFWLRDLGSVIELKKGALWLAFMVLTIAAGSNLAEYAWSQWPQFGGMSGVVYGLFGYIWIKGRLQPHEQFFMPQQTVIIMLAWLVICMTGSLGPIANAAHVAGLGLGAGFAYAAWASARLRAQLRRR